MSVGRPSLYQESAAALDLREFVACRWVRVVGDETAGTPVPIIPDGCSDVMAYDDEPPWVAGPDAVTRWVSLRPGTVITGLRIRPGAARALFTCEARLLLNGSMRLSDLVSGAAGLHARLLKASSLNARFEALEQWARAALLPTAADRGLVAACRAMTFEPTLSVDAMARRTGWSVRTAHRQFHAGCGYGPKHFQRIIRVQRAIRDMHRATPVRFADAALAAGFADQAHFSRDFRDLTGFSPRQYLARSRPEFGAWLDAGW